MPSAMKEIDLHGLNRYQAQIKIEAALKKVYGLYRIRLIHGYHHGDSLQKFIEENYAHDPRLLRLEHVSPGVSDLVLRELL